MRVSAYLVKIMPLDAHACLLGGLWSEDEDMDQAFGCFGIETVFAKVGLSKRTFRKMELVHLFDFADREDTAATYDGRVQGGTLSIFAEYDVRSATSWRAGPQPVVAPSCCGQRRGPGGGLHRG